MRLFFKQADLFLLLIKQMQQVIVGPRNFLVLKRAKNFHIVFEVSPGWWDYLDVSKVLRVVSLLKGLLHQCHLGLALSTGLADVMR
jgi:hypothetical protein